MHFTTTSEAVRAWVHGWALSRGAAEPDPAPWGFTVTTGPPRHAVSHVLTTADAATVREVTAGTTRPGVRLKAFVRAEALAPWIAPGWSLSGEPGHLMSAPLHSARTPALPPLLPDGYRLRTWTRDGVTHARVCAADGTQAARGQTAVTGATAVVDKVETHLAHRRRGLGRLIMRVLTDAAAEQGATVGLLASSAEGRALYEATGWRVTAPLANALRGPGPAGHRRPGSRAGTHDPAASGQAYS
ncbi:GNAT family N-acetyltransferase [Streptomyces sp. NE06-03E]|uniref:GNAT family N-acetyltransferase n=1 Tax=Streptomyces sp. NE06-03E TaxID=3028695 RepID=UPI00299FE732|nr:GNAT family N-acetyltransferase [Streptomyces sp. NE06-03E]MDX3056093.1 GNAT family N-acetyltransferase [Streptomyces sp. NE06-03E]